MNEKESEKKIEEEIEEESEEGIASKLKMSGFRYFFAIILIMAVLGSILLFKIDTTTSDENIAKMGFIMIIMLVLGGFGFVGSMYLTHPMKWSLQMMHKGRTLEYITVTLIIAIVLVLALVGEIGEETVGTILGAIAGYVLGRSVTPQGG